MSEQIKQASTYGELQARVKAIRELRKSAMADDGDTEDPRNKGTVSIPNHPDGDSEEKTQIPANSHPDNKEGLEDGVTKETSPGGTGENVPAVKNCGDAKDDAFTSSTTSLDKCASGVSATVGRLQALRGGQTKVAAEVKAAPGQSKAANEAPAELIPSRISDEHHIKLASEILATEEGIAFASDYLTKRAGQKVANDIINDAITMQEQFAQLGDAEYQAQAQYQEFEKAAAQQEAAINEALQGATPEQVEVFYKTAAAHNEILSQIDDPVMQDFYRAGVIDAGLIKDSMAGPEAAMMAEGDPAAMGGEEAAMGLPPEEAMLPGADAEGPSPEQIEAVIGALVEQGQLAPEEAEAILAELAGGGDPAMGAEGGEEAAIAEAMGGGGEEAAMAEAMGAAEEMPKMASNNASVYDLAAELIPGWGA